MRFARWAGLLGVVLACLAAVPQDEGVVIKRKLTPGADAQYHVEGSLAQTVTLPDGSSQAMPGDVSGDFEIESGDELQDGKLPITVTVRDLTIKSADGEERVKKANLTAKIDETNTLSDVQLKELKDNNPSIVSLISRMAQGPGTFSDQPVKPGDAWPVVEQSSFLGAKKLEYKLQYDGQQTIDSTSFFALSADTDIDVSIDTGAMEDPAGQPTSTGSMVMKGTVHVTLHALVNADGLLHSMEFETKAEMTIDAPQANGQIRLESDELLKVSRVED